jgi:hypothetical protein
VDRQEGEHAARIDQMPDHARGVQECTFRTLATLHDPIVTHQYKPSNTRPAPFSGLLGTVVEPAVKPLALAEGK